MSKEFKMNKKNNLQSKLTKKTIYLTDASKLIDKINNLSPYLKINNEIIKTCNKIKKDLEALEESINKKSTDNKEKIKELFGLIREIFDKEASSKSKKNKVLENIKKSQEKHVERIRKIKPSKRSLESIISDNEKEEDDDLARQYIPPR